MREIKQDTTAIRTDTEALRLGNAEILDQISNLQEMIMQDEGPVPRTFYVLQRYLDSLTMYAETLAGRSERALSDVEEHVQKRKQQNTADDNIPLQQGSPRPLSSNGNRPNVQLLENVLTVSGATSVSDSTEPFAGLPTSHDGGKEAHLTQLNSLTPDASTHPGSEESSTEIPRPLSRIIHEDSAQSDGEFANFTSTKVKEGSLLRPRRYHHYQYQI